MADVTELVQHKYAYRPSVVLLQSPLGIVSGSVTSFHPNPLGNGMTLFLLLG